jgi:hypothetical protein
MSNEPVSPFHGVLLKFALLWAPAVVILWYLKLRGIRSRIFNIISCANIVCYLLWLLGMVTVHTPIVYRWISECKPAIPVLMFFSAFLFVLWPIFASMVSFVLFMASFGVQPGERRFFVSANLLMLILWASTIVAPN